MQVFLFLYPYVVNVNTTMVPSGEFKSIPVTSITISEKWSLTPFLLSSPPPNKSHHVTSATGLLHPPVVRKMDKKEASYELLCGQERFKSFLNGFPDLSQVTVRVLPQDIPHQEILQYILDDKLVSGTFSVMEKAIFLQYCCNFLPSETVIQNFLSPLEEKPQPYILKKLLALTALEPALQQSIHLESLSPKLGHELLTLSSDDRLKLHDLFQYLELGGGKQKRLLTLCKDLAYRQNKKIQSLLAEDDYVTILEHTEMNAPQKGASILSLLYKQLFPESNAAEEDFRKRVLRMELPENCMVEHSPAFERDEISLTVQFKDMNQLEEQAHRIKEFLS